MNDRTMAVIALVGAIVFAPVGIVFGHLLLARRPSVRERRIAIAALVIGYVLLVSAVGIVLAPLLASLAA
jgi:peptidyl-prolyl cis-trans isomerase B (cyclophilin B)